MGFADLDISLRDKSSNIAFVREKHRRGIPMSREEVSMLVSTGEVEREAADILAPSTTTKAAFEALDRYVLTREMYMDRCGDHATAWEGKDIRVGDWKPEDPAEITEDFREFIVSHFTRFCDLKAYEPMFLYMEQARRWSEEPMPDFTMMDPLQVRDWWFEEWLRCRDNTLYAIDRYGRYKEGSSDSGDDPFVANMAHCLIAFLVDCGRSGLIGKPRQMASTTEFMLIMVFKISVLPNIFIKFIACQKEKSEEIFTHKFVFGFGKLPDELKPETLNDLDSRFRVSFAKDDAKKGSRKTDTSELRVAAPTIDAINGGAPDIVLIDEGVFLDNFRDIMMEGRPTMFVKKGGRLKMVRQLWGWGTGGRSVKSGGQFEIEHRKLFDMWSAGKPDPLIPLFLDWTCRPGVDEEHYLKEKASYMSGVADGLQGGGSEQWALQFRQHYPSNIDDMYAVSSNSLMGSMFIIRNTDKINALPHDMRGIKGRFIPQFDTTEKFPSESFLPHPVSGWEFIKADKYDLSAPVEMFIPPEDYTGWADRCYQGTDPIQTDEGYSNHASVIWDAHYRTVPCIVDMRTGDAYDSYLQSKLMGMAYAGVGKRFCPELVENNAGKLYIKWMKSHEWRALQSLVSSYRLPDHLQQKSGGDDIGINTSGTRKPFMVEFGKGMLHAHGDNIYIPKIFEQLKYFVATTTADRRIKHGVDNYKKRHDDVVDALFLAFLARTAHQHAQPRFTGGRNGEVGNGPVKFRPVFDRTTMTRRVVPYTSATRAA